MDDKIKLIQENVRLAFEVDSLKATVEMYQRLTSMMAKSLDKENIPLNNEEFERIRNDYEMRMKQVTQLFDMNKFLLESFVGMRTGESSFGMRTGKVTEEDVNRILSDIDPEIVKKMGE